jgi:hypothetical protein
MNIMRFVFATAAFCPLVSFALAEEAYNPAIDPADFTTRIDNPLFNLPPGKTMVFEAKTEDGVERVEVRITAGIRTIMGVETVVANDRSSLDGKLEEETNDYLAQDKHGNVWYFGESVDNYSRGKLRDHRGSWIAGEEGALPGIWINANPKVGDTYRQEYKKGVAEDMAEVVAVGQTVKVPAGEFKNCVKVFEWTPLEPSSKANKYYCPQTGSQVLEEELADKVRSELTSVTGG